MGPSSALTAGLTDGDDDAGCAAGAFPLRPGTLDTKPTGWYCSPMAPTQPRQERAERTRAHIIEAAATAFAERGFDGVSLNDLVAASGLSKGAFYFHFSSKEEIALAAFQSKQQEMLSLLADRPAPEEAADRVAFLMRTRAHLLREDPSLRCITRLGSQFNLRSAPGSVYAGYLDAAQAALADLVARGQRRGEFRTDIHPQAASRTLFAALVGIDSLSHATSGGTDLEARTDDLIDVVLNGLLEPAGRGQRRRSPAEESRHGSLRSTRPSGRARPGRPAGNGANRGRQE